MTKKSLLKTLLISFVTCGMLSCPPAAFKAECSEELHSYIEIDIHMESTVFKTQEPIEGEVIINNTSPATLPGAFTIKLFKEGELKFITTTMLKTIFPGETKFTFKNFGIPNINDATASGNWRLIVHPANREEKDGASKDFVIK